MLCKLFGWVPWVHRWDLVPDADLDDVRTCERCGRRDVLQVDGWHRITAPTQPAKPQFPPAQP